MNALERWHEIITSGDPGGLDGILAEDCVFLSPVVHTPQRGRALVTLYLTGAMQVLNHKFSYIRQVVDAAAGNAVLEFTCEIDGIEVNGVDIISFDEAGLIREFKVMLRPLKAINVVHSRMRQMLEALAGSTDGQSIIPAGDAAS